MNLLIEATRKFSTDQIRAAAMQIGGAFDVDPDVRMTRAALIEVYAEREGDEAADELMDAIGL